MTPDLDLPLVAAVRLDRAVVGLGGVGRAGPHGDRAAAAARDGVCRWPVGSRSRSERQGCRTPDPRLERIAKMLPKSPKEMGRLRRRLATGRHHQFRGGGRLFDRRVRCCHSSSASLASSFFVGPMAWILHVDRGVVGYMIPGLFSCG